MKLMHKGQYDVYIVKHATVFLHTQVLFCIKHSAWFQGDVTPILTVL